MITRFFFDFLLGNTSEPAIDFHGTFVRFPGSITTNLHFPLLLGKCHTQCIEIPSRRAFPASASVVPCAFGIPPATLAGNNLVDQACTHSLLIQVDDQALHHADSMAMGRNCPGASTLLSLRSKSWPQMSFLRTFQIAVERLHANLH